MTTNNFFSNTTLTSLQRNIFRMFYGRWYGIKFVAKVIEYISEGELVR